MNKDEQLLFKKNSFLEKELAEKNRELEIEASLERVREKAMAMRASEELKEVVKTLFEELTRLDVNLQACLIATFDAVTYDQRSWIIHSKTNEPYSFLIPNNQQPFYQEMLRAWKERNPNWSYMLEGEPKINWESFLFTDTEFRLLPKEVKEEMLKPKKVFFVASYYQYGAIQASSPEPLSNASINILQRFSKVFDSCYTRFLDLKKAESQAREAQIQLALERVRAKTMAMQKPSEFVDVINKIGEQFMHLGFDFDWVNFSANGLDVSKAIDIYNFHVIPGLHQRATRVVIPFFEHPVFKKAEESINEYQTSGNSFTVVQLGKKDKDTWLDHLFKNTLYKDLPDEAKTSQYNREVYQSSNVMLKDTWLSIGKYDAQPLTDEQIAILKRLANEFGQAYTRFLDLQKAEAQAREAQIEAGLERVRSRAMAMQTSEELAPLIGTVFTELTRLDLALTRCVIWIFDPATNGATWWMANSEDAQNPISCDLPYNAYEPYLVFLEQWKKRANKFQYELSGTIKKDWDGYLFSKTGLSRLPAIVIEGMIAPERVFLTASFNNFGALNAATLAPLSDQDLDILLRFARVFDLTYTRFNDLKQAEAQAREAQIEAALEKVRSRSLAMHKSDELKDLVLIVFEKLKELNIVVDGGVTISIYTEGSRDQVQWVAAPDLISSTRFSLPYKEDKIISDHIHAKESGLDFFAKTYSYEDKNKMLDYLFNDTDFKYVPEEIKKFVLQSESYSQSIAFSKDSSIFINSYSGVLLSGKEAEVLKRFAKVFEQAYIRFLDLQKAEAQAREAQIELGLERVRARAMAMQKSDELKELIGTVFTELTKLDLVLTRCVIMIYDTNNLGITWWMANSEDPSNPSGLFVKYHQLPPHLAYIEAWKERYLKWQYILEGKIKKEWDNFLFSETELSLLPDFVIAGMKAPDRVYLNASFNSFGNLTLATLEPLSNEHADILLRFAKVFDLTYTRFNDLQKAEAQAREAQIELALERVRARTMAMQHSKDLTDVANLLFQQVQTLGVPSWSCGFNIWEEKEKCYTAWMSSEGILQPPFKLPLSEIQTFNHFYESRQKGELFYVEEMGGDALVAQYQYMRGLPGFGEILDDFLKSGFTLPTFQINHVVNFKQGNLIFITSVPVPQAVNIFIRFAKVFEQTYTRFLDLQKAEAQAREAPIEAALERVRSKTMAMHSSQDIAETVDILFHELTKLHVDTLRCGISIIHDTKEMEVWTANPDADGKASLTIGKLPMSINPSLEKLFEVWKNKESHFVYDLSGQDLIDYFTAINNAPDYPIHYDLSKLPPRQVINCFLFTEGALFVFTTDLLTSEAIAIFKRFATVFGQTYRRYLDLQKAEAQAREAKIEAGLERVRAKAMSMHSSRDLADTIDVFYHEIEWLSITPRRCGVGLMDKETHFVELSTMNTTELGDSIEIIGKLKLTGHPVLEGIYDNWILQKEYHPVLRGNEIKKYYQLIRPQIAYPDYPTDTAQYGYFFFFNEGGVYAWTEKELSEAELKIYRRFTTVLSLTYKRYKDLKDAEANTREAIKRASLDRVRAETASMRSTGDLERITPLIWNELTTLGVPFIRCGVFIMDEQQEQIHSFLSTPDGKAIAAFQLPYDSAGELSKVLAHWHKNEIFKDHWDEAAFAEWTKSLVEQGAIASEEKYSTTHRPVNLDLHFLPFLQGMLYVGSEAPLNDEEIHLVQSLADAFSTAYARYEDFNKLEAAKKQVDSTLNELQATQKQLIQSEKMASLGELTAGIAHEIQNPLNFVNNFSEVSTELIDEMNEEIDKGNNEEAKLIALDLKENLEKINHHGKRAGDIVKGMLQHSRKSTGQKEPTDINALADEYLRLSYHGLRAKDKGFNAEMKTDFDESIGKINIIPQDIGRVLLNLFNNAFYAVNKQKGSNSISYEPKVFVRTQKSDDKIQIIVRDNGKGIPQKIVDKIFQPFFTTKPTGQGTGLGLSLSYDIIKAHGGEIKVESKEGEGSEFVIQLPV